MYEHMMWSEIAYPPLRDIHMGRERKKLRLLKLKSTDCNLDISVLVTY